jgi:hypothetical protein
MGLSQPENGLCNGTVFRLGTPKPMVITKRIDSAAYYSPLRLPFDKLGQTFSSLAVPHASLSKNGKSYFNRN